MHKIIYLNGPGAEHITFPTGEQHARIPDLDSTNSVVIRYDDPSGGIMKLAMLVDICRNARVKFIDLEMPFVPYARQDRRAADGDPMSISVFTKYINDMGFRMVTIRDPHSDVTEALINNVHIISQEHYAYRAYMVLQDFYDTPIAIVAPDLGAAKKIKRLKALIYNRTGQDIPIIQCDKTRDVDTGRIDGFCILDGDPKGMHCFMVDDIIDGGGTALGLASVLHQSGAHSQSFFATHGIFSKGLKTLNLIFDQIFTTDSFGAREGVHII